CVIMDMVYKPIETPFLHWAKSLNRRTVDGLAMLIGQAAPSFGAFYGRPPPSGVSVRALALKALEP
ncbi:MAG: shikimate dehydrogenase, partial [Phenylobacterium sp.]